MKTVPKTVPGTLKNVVFTGKNKERPTGIGPVDGIFGKTAKTAEVSINS